MLYLSLYGKLEKLMLLKYSQTFDFFRRCEFRISLLYLLPSPSDRLQRWEASVNVTLPHDYVERFFRNTWFNKFEYLDDKIVVVIACVRFRFKNMFNDCLRFFYFHFVFANGSSLYSSDTFINPSESVCGAGASSFFFSTNSHSSAITSNVYFFSPFLSVYEPV